VSRRRRLLVAAGFLLVPALGSLSGGAGYAVFTLFVSAFFLGSPDGLGLPLTRLPGWHGVLWGAVFWLLSEMRRLSQEKPA
jgi:hypothetical protein